MGNGIIYLRYQRFDYPADEVNSATATGGPDIAIPSGYFRDFLGDLQTLAGSEKSEWLMRDAENSVVEGKSVQQLAPDAAC